MVVVFGLDDGNREIGLVEEEIVDLLGFSSTDGFAANNHPALREVDLLTKLGHHVPFLAVRAKNCRRNELRADIRFREFLLIHLVLAAIKARGADWPLPG